MSTINIGTLEALIRLRDEMSPAMKKTMATIKEAAKAAAVLGAGIAIANKALQAQAQQEAAINKLNLALANQGKFTDEASKRLVAFSSAMQDVTTFGDEAVLAVQATFASFGVSVPVIEEATKATLDFASATGTDLTAAANLLGKAAVGETGALSRYGIVIDQNIPKSERFVAVLAQLNQRFGGQAQAETLTYAGAMKQLDNAMGDTWESLGKLIGEVANFGGGGGPMSAAIDIVKRFNKFLGEDLVRILGVARAVFAETFADMLMWVAGLAEKIQAFSPKLAGRLGITQEGIDSAKRFAEGLQVSAAGLEKEGHAAAESAGKTQTFTNVLRQAGPAAGDAAEAMKRLTAELDHLDKTTGHAEASITAMFEAQRESIDAAAEAAQIQGELAAEIAAAKERIDDETYALREQEAAIVELTRLWNEWLGMDVPKTAADWAEEFRGAADVLHEVDGLFDELGVSASSKLRRITQDWIAMADAGADFFIAFMKGDVAGMIAAGIASLTATISLTKNIFNDIEWEQVNDLRDDFVEAAGGIDELNKRAVAAGLSLDQLLDAKKVKDFDEAVEMLEERLEFIESFGGLEELKFQADAASISLDGLFNAQNARELSAEITLIQEKLGLWNDANEKLNAAAEKYGFTVEEMGAKFAQQKLDEQFGSLFEEYNLLTAAGFDHNAVLERMGPNMSDYVNNVIAAGGTIPEAMRPIIEKFIENGSLLDANGEAFESVEATGISFAQTLEEGISKLIDSVQKLVDALKGIPTDLNVNTSFTTTGHPPGGPPFGGDYPGFAHGGVVPWTGPAMLHGTPQNPEFVLDSAQLAAAVAKGVAMAGGGGAGGAGPTTIAITIPGAQDPHEVGRQVVEAIRHNAGGLRSELKHTARL